MLLSLFVYGCVCDSVSDMCTVRGVVVCDVVCVCRGEGRGREITDALT